MTQQELAERARVGVNTISELERGRHPRCQLQTARRLAAALGQTGASGSSFIAAARGLIPVSAAPGGQAPDHLAQASPAAPTAPECHVGNGATRRDSGDDGPVDNGTLPGFLHIAQRYDLALSPPQQRPAILRRVAGIATRGQARQYPEEVAAKAAAARANRGL